LIFSLNVSILFTELPYLDRFAAARAAGFTAVESWWPPSRDLDRVVEAVRESELQLVALNFDGGDIAAGDRGILSDPDRAERFRGSVPIALEIAARAGCARLNALLGLEHPDIGRREQLALAAEQVRWAADRASDRGATVLIEPVNRRDNGPYLLDTPDGAVEFIAALDRSNVRLLLDCFHAQRAGDDPAGAAARHFDRIGHVQIADSPDRHEPGTGEIDFRRLFGVLARLGYEGHVGLEYRPRETSAGSLDWLPASQRGRDFDIGAVFGKPADGPKPHL
jgi:hydroxypyruvate isomerase